MKDEIKYDNTFDLLVEKIKYDDVDAVEILFRQYYDPLVHYSFRYVKNIQTAEDVVHDIFLKLWINRHKIEFGVNIKTYLFNSVRNQSIKYLQKHSREETYKSRNYEIEYDLDTPEIQLFNKESKESIQNVVMKLPPKCREIFCMNRFDELTYIEIASILEISIKTVETQMSRALKFLRKNLSSFFKS
jgi:RNA polymerase sigma-70 factor (ECF subfamily)